MAIRSVLRQTARTLAAHSYPPQDQSERDQNDGTAHMAEEAGGGRRDQINDGNINKQVRFHTDHPIALP
jgi:hypothetical protein